MEIHNKNNTKFNKMNSHLETKPLLGAVFPPRSCKTLLLVEGLSARPGGGGDPWPCWCERKDPYKRPLLNEWRIPINELPRVNGGPYSKYVAARRQAIGCSEN